MADRDIFRVMCNLWGVGTALEKSVGFGITVSQAEIDAQMKVQQQKSQNARRVLALRNEEKEKKDA